MQTFRIPVFTSALAIASLIAVGNAGAQAYNNDFQTSINKPGGTWSVTGTDPLILNSRAGQPSQSLGIDRVDGSGWGATGTLWNQTASLSLDPLGVYTGGSVMFDVYVWGSWDQAGCCGPDRFLFNINGGPNLVDTSFPLISLGGDYRGMQSFVVPFSFLQGGSNPVLNFVAAATQADEGLTFDNVRVDITGQQVPSGVVPEPMSVVLMGTGLLGVAAVLRRRRRSNLIAG
jgi:hypothetical protein